MTELTKTDFRLATMLTRIAVLASAMLVLASCYDIIYEPVFVPEDGSSDFIPYDKEVIPAEGDTCWFYRELNRIVVKAFDPSEAIYPYRWKLLIDGNMVQENPREYLETYSKEVMEWWERRTELKWMDNAILFEVPANSSADERSVEVKVSVSSGLYNSEQEDDWGEWFTVFEGTQAGRVYPDEMMPSHSLEKSQANIFEPVRINMHKCDEAGNLSWYRLNGICDSLIWSVKGLEGSRVVMNTNNETIYFGHRFTLPGEYESVLSAYKGNRVIYKDVKNITITDDKDFLMFDWEEVISGNAQGEAYLNALNPDVEFGSIVKCDDGNPQIFIYVVPSDRLTPEDERQILYNYMCELYYVPTGTGNGQAEWATDTSVARLVNTYNEFTETDEWRIIAEPLRD